MKNNNPHDLNRKLTAEEYDLLYGPNHLNQQTSSSHHAGSLTVGHTQTAGSNGVSVAAPSSPISITGNQRSNHIITPLSAQSPGSVMIGTPSTGSASGITVTNHFLGTPTSPAHHAEQVSFASSSMSSNNLFSTPQKSRGGAPHHFNISPSNIDFATAQINQYMFNHNMAHIHNPIVSYSHQGNMVTFTLQDGVPIFMQILTNNHHQDDFPIQDPIDFTIYDDMEEGSVIEEEINYSDDESDEEYNHKDHNPGYASTDSESEESQQVIYTSTSSNGRQLTIEEAFARSLKRSRDAEDQTEEEATDTSNVENDGNDSKKARTDSEYLPEEDRTSEEDGSSAGSESPPKPEFEISGDLEETIWDMV